MVVFFGKITFCAEGFDINLPKVAEILAKGQQNARLAAKKFVPKPVAI
jgi:FMN-dependent NADH-azoreductase